MRAAVTSGAGGGAARVVRACVDTGGRDTAAVYGHLRRLADPRIVAIKGVDGWNRSQPVMGPTKVDARQGAAKVRRGLSLYTVAVSTFKMDLYRRLWSSRGESGETPPGWVHLPQGVDAEWVRQLVAEQLRTVRLARGGSRQEWAKVRDRNEALDMAVYARAALWMLRPDRPGFWARQEQRVEEVASAPPVAVAEAVAVRPEVAAVQQAAPVRPRWQPRGSW
jgi:phage terminase large subunit GpA-like protein